MTNTAASQVPLVAELKHVGLRLLAARAADNEFHDFLTPHAMPQHVLASELVHAAKQYPSMAAAIMRIREDVIDGKYDATREESEAWARSPEGQVAFLELYRGKHGS